MKPVLFPALSAMLSRVFESSKTLDDVALHHLIDALCKLSNEAMELAYSNRVSGTWVPDVWSMWPCEMK